MPQFNFKSIKSITDEMEDDDEEKVKANKAYDRMIHMDWHIPQEWKELGWIKEIKSSEPYDIIRSATRTLATKEPLLQLTPINDTAEQRHYFNEIETALMWHYRQASRRAHSFPTRDIVESIIRYDELVVNVIYLPYQDAALKAINGKRKEAANQFGPFVIKVHNPTYAHVRYSDYMPEAVFLKRPVKAYKVANFWGDRAKAFAKKFEDNMTEEVFECDYTSGDQRCVWIETSDGGSSDTPDDFLLVRPNEEYKIPFLPWVARVGGTAMDDDEGRKRQPILYSNYKTRSSETQQMFGSLMYSLSMYRATMPIDDVTSPTGEGVEIDATGPVGQMAHDQMTQVKRLPPAGIDPVIQQMYDRLVTDQSKSAGTSILQTGQVANRTSFAVFNAAMQAAVAVLDAPKEMSEKGIGDVMSLFVQWAKFSKEPLMYYNETKGSPTYGKQGNLAWDKLPDPEDLYIKVTLEKSVPVDEIARINAMQMLTTAFMYPQSRALEVLGVSDPDQAMVEWKEEQLNKAAVGQEVADLQFEADQMRQKQAMQAQQGARGQPGAPMQPGQGAFPGGQANNPAVGGASPMGAAPGMTQQTMNGPTQPNPQAQGMDFRGMTASGATPETTIGRKAVK